jgi:hypothetical protein
LIIFPRQLRQKPHVRKCTENPGALPSFPDSRAGWNPAHAVAAFISGKTDAPAVPAVASEAGRPIRLRGDRFDYRPAARVLTVMRPAGLIGFDIHPVLLTVYNK